VAVVTIASIVSRAAKMSLRNEDLCRVEEVDISAYFHIGFEAAFGYEVHSMAQYHLQFLD
jgi:hypothetical protein